MTVERVTFGRDGPIEQSMPSSKAYASSSDYSNGGVTVRTGGFNREVHSTNDLNDNDLMTVDGMELTVAQARQLGLLNTAFDEQLSFGAAQRAAQEHGAAQERAAEQTQGSNTGNADFDSVVDGLNTSLDDGVMELGEAQEYETAFGQLAMSGMTIDQAAETMRGLADGSVSELDVDGDTRAMFENVQSTITKAATQSAMQELGQDGFDFLTQASATNPGVDRVVRQFAVDRAAGRADGITWAEFAQHIREQLGH
ncbi:hypothetical protein [Ruegeria atlantica]|uniref:Uncharacterized protein n=1 Tax=Ruegeria atlantica TaxID=81569 RepID=A0ABX1WDV9_9RHOB|nr:hypothetical protein [Ruegeria atlantica]NOD31491.1 hypothetical protein [Ruegeria atlantica]